MATCSDPKLSDLSGSSSHPNPFFDFLTGFVPRKLKDLFRWCEYLTYNSAHIYAALKKFAEYPVTTLVYESNSDGAKDKWRDLHENKLHLRAASLRCAFDKYVYGNSFVSVYQPFQRYLECQSCKKLTNITAVKYQFNLKKLTFKFHCTHCDASTQGEAIDKRIQDPNGINIIHWDPKLIDIDYNPITNDSVYYYTIPTELKEKIRKGDPNILDRTPMEFIKAVRDKNLFRFNKGSIYHLKINGPSGIDAQWGFPPLSSTIKLFLYTAVLRKANEAIAMEHIVPFRVMHPQQTSGAVEPAQMINLRNFQDNLKRNYKQWRRDPNHIMFSPIAVGVTNVGGDGRAMLTLGEVKEAEDNIIAAMGIPKEFLYGGLTKAGMEATLRILENQLQGDVDDLNGVAQWITDKCAKYLNWERVEVYWQPFKMVDDTERKQMLFQMSPMGGQNIVSKTTVAEVFDLDLVAEREKILQETMADQRFQMEMDKKIQELQNSLAQQAQQGAAADTGLNYDQQAVIAQADSIVQELMNYDQGTRQSMLSSLEGEDAVMHAMVVKRLQDFQNQETAQMRAQGGM